MLVCFCLLWRVLPVARRLLRWLLACRFWSAAWLLVLVLFLLVPLRRRVVCLLLVRRVWRRLAWLLRFRHLMRRLLAPLFRRRLPRSLPLSRAALSRAVLSMPARVLPRWLARPLALHPWHRPRRSPRLRLALPWRVTPRRPPMLRRHRMPRLLLQQLRRVPPPRL